VKCEGLHTFKVLLALVAAVLSGRVQAQVVTERGFVEARGQLFPQDAPNDPTQAVADLLFREEAFAKLTSWLQLAAGVDVRASSHDQVEDEWRIDVSDRGVRRPRVSLRRATATVAYRRFTVDVGKQFIRWGKTDILNPTDRFAPRDFLNVIDANVVAVTGLRVAARVRGQDTVEAVWLPRFTPSRIPLLNERWTAVPADAPQLQIVDAGAVLPSGSQTGVRWSHLGDRLEYSASFFDGFNHLPNIDARVRPALSGVEGPDTFVPEVDVTRTYPRIRAYGADLAMPTPWLTIKGEVAYLDSSSLTTDEYVLYVVQVERQSGEWVLIAGYAGEWVTDRRAVLTFAPDRGLTNAAVGRASYTIDPNRSVTFETAVRRNLNGAYGKAEYSQAYAQHWRATITGVIIRGEPDDFLGQYRRNSHLSIALRYSF
jgi:hypothetical protein